VASIGDILVAVGIVWLAAALTMAHPSADIAADRGALAA
jgi:hypothetical protein